MLRHTDKFNHYETDAGNVFRTSTWADREVEFMPVNRWLVSLHVEGYATSFLRSTLLGPTTLAEVVEAVDGLAARCAAMYPDKVIRGLQALPQYTLDGCYVWSGKPLGEGTVGAREHDECVLAMLATTGAVA